MYIKSIVLDGFKSYGQRTEINGFDSEFNAITGLNGTGKSNILDSICFVLGITSLSNVRVTSLQDLIYKCGQSGITKATVSVTFDNRDKNQCPVGYLEHDNITVTRQVVMGGKNKYMINGVQVQNKRVADMFGSVQLNVNNPHFLIMQGRITKVLNMKPVEILSMIEESAGTRMYEEKKKSTQKQIEKKDLKLKEFDRTNSEEIEPKLAQLRQERQVFIEFQRVEKMLEKISKLYSGWQFVQTKKQMQKSINDLENKTKEIEEIQENMDQNKLKADEIDAEVAEHQQKDGEHNDRLQANEKEMKEKEKIVAKSNAAEKAAQDDVKNEEKKLKMLITSLANDQKSLQAKEKEMNDWNDVFHNLKQTEVSDSAAFAAAQKKFEAVSAGMEIGDDGEAATLQEQLMKATQNATEASTESKLASMQLQKSDSELKQKQRELGASSTDYKSDKLSVDNLEKDVKNMTHQLANLNFDDKRMSEAKNMKRTLTEDCYRIRSKLERFEARYPLSNFQYQDPEPNFNRRSVKGLVCKLISLRDKSASIALETAAGGRLFNIITDTEITSKKLLQRGQLQHRTTIIPLNKIKGYPIPTDVVNYAQQLVGKENVRSAISVIQFNKELQPAMDYIFGSVLICHDMNVARKVAFDPRIQRKCVTLDGDVVNPAGVLSGGASKSDASFLLQLEEYMDQKSQLSSKEQELLQIETELQNMLRVADRYLELKNRCDMKTHELSVVQERLQNSSHYQLQQEIEILKKNIVDLTQKIKTCNDEEKTNKAKAKDIENKIKNSKNYKEQMLKDAENDMKRLKKISEKSKAEWKQKEEEYESLKLEIISLQNAIVTDQDQIKQCEQNVIESKQKYEETNQLALEAKEQYSIIHVAYKEQKAVLASKNKDIQKKLQAKTDLLAQIFQMELDIKKRTFKIKELEEKCKDYKAKEAELKKKSKSNDSSIQEAENMSDKEGHELGKQYAKVQDERNKMSRMVNAKAQRLFEQEEKQYKELMKKYKIVADDKAKLLQVIAELDEKKINFLQTAAEQISKDFGLIFSTLLPGTDAKLKQPDGKGLLDGLEIKVGIGGIWKDNLSELSGGQKSLVALSLILAMLRFKPAPIYILDEVDAALDLSHTQNIGKMLKMYFKSSQFIIVSLKDGMFNNANVLFQTKFEDGMSAVSKTVNRH